MAMTKDVVVIGAGVIGCAVGYELARRGFHCVNVDQAPTAGYGSTSSSSTVVRAHYSTRDGVAMAYEGFSYWRHWPEYLEITDGRGLARFVNSGFISFLTGDNDLEKRVIRHYETVGVEHQVWGPSDLATYWPFCDFRRFGPPKRPEDPAFYDEPAAENILPGAIFTPGAGYVTDAQLAAYNLQRAAEAHGGAFLFGRQVTAILTESGRTQGVRLADGETCWAPVVVNVAGPHSGIINRLAGVEATMRVKTRPMRHEVHVVPSPPGVDFERWGCPAVDEDLGIYFRPQAGNMIMVGSIDPPCDPPAWWDDPDHVDRQVTQEQFTVQVFRLARRLPSLPIPRTPLGVADLYDVSDDWVPIYDRSDLPGFYMAVGTSGNQFKNAGVAGHVMAELIVACENGLDHDREPLRIRGRFTGCEMNVGFFSRRRALVESSLSVLG